ncbi:hypothetical protein [Streptomyces sp. NK08204]|uniref:hypothetical protein n=1 Tax=Streptomyces sp. NK08204 TaxID=2873260 RepID=UPI001CED20D3|nr:hypothetical protein [Streptomyces sp. NK08204]
MPQSTSTTQAQPSPQTEPWPDGVIARYLTVAGATFDLKQDETSRGYADSGDCNGCGHHIGWTRVDIARQEAQSHAERCRALPRPQVTT